MRELTGNSFIEGILNGERAFPRIQLPDGFRLSSHPRFEELNKYLKAQGLDNLKKEPLIIRNSMLNGLVAERLYLPYVQGEMANLEKANLEKAYLFGANLEGAIISGSHLDTIVIKI